jgi:hypothetical protein
MLPGERVHITPKTMHRMTAIEDSDIFEVSTPELTTWSGWRIATGGRTGNWRLGLGELGFAHD